MQTPQDLFQKDLQKDLVAKAQSTQHELDALVGLYALFEHVSCTLLSIVSNNANSNNANSETEHDVLKSWSAFFIDTFNSEKLRLERQIVLLDIALEATTNSDSSQVSLEKSLEKPLKVSLEADSSWDCCKETFNPRERKPMCWGAHSSPVVAMTALCTLMNRMLVTLSKLEKTQTQPNSEINSAINVERDANASALLQQCVSTLIVEALAIARTSKSYDELSAKQILICLGWPRVSPEIRAVCDARALRRHVEDFNFDASDASADELTSAFREAVIHGRSEIVCVLLPLFVKFYDESRELDLYPLFLCFRNELLQCKKLETSEEETEATTKTREKHKRLFAQTCRFFFDSKHVSSVYDAASLPWDDNAMIKFLTLHYLHIVFPRSKNVAITYLWRALGHNNFDSFFLVLRTFPEAFQGSLEETVLDVCLNHYLIPRWTPTALRQLIKLVACNNRRQLTNYLRCVLWDSLERPFTLCNKLRVEFLINESATPIDTRAILERLFRFFPDYPLSFNDFKTLLTILLTNDRTANCIEFEPLFERVVATHVTDDSFSILSLLFDFADQQLKKANFAVRWQWQRLIRKSLVRSVKYLVHEPLYLPSKRELVVRVVRWSMTHKEFTTDAWKQLAHCFGSPGVPSCVKKELLDWPMLPPALGEKTRRAWLGEG